MSLVATFDVGTTNARVSLFDPSGEVVATAVRRLGASFPGHGLVEQDPAELVEVPLGLLGETLGDLGATPGDVAGIGVVNQRGSVVAWDRTTGVAFGGMIGWQDRRTIERVEELKSLGLPLNTQASCTKFEWLTTQHPEVMAAASAGTLCMGTPDAWITWKLTGGTAFVTDPSNAGATGLYDPGTREWLDMGMELFGQDLAWHATLVPTSEVVGTTPAALTGAEIPVAARAGDQQAAAFAQGLLSEGSAKLTLGTSAMLDVCVGQVPVTDTPTGTYCLPMWRLHAESLARVPGAEFDAADGGGGGGGGGGQADGDRHRGEGRGLIETYMTEASAATAGAAIEWLVRIGLLDGVEALDEVVAGAKETDALMVPALAGLGAPFGLDQARATLVGVGQETGRAELVTAVVEGVAHRCADLIEALEVEGSIGVDGGLANSEALLARVADHSGRELVVAGDLEASARGAAMLAAIAPGVDAEPLEVPASERSIQPSADDDTRTAARARHLAAIEAARQVAGA